ncbi:MAG TPA: DHH family phosphoesterase [Candidatus Deferrimicrobium sp.]|nr:DHH family phosphoesterase [Candidatus Deferrimicrobium sp.]
MNPFDLNDEFYTVLETAAKRLKIRIDAGELIRVSSHIDADGLSAAGIVCSALQRLKARFHLRILRQLDPEFIEALAEEKHNCYIFSDFGSGQIDLLAKFFPKEDLIVLDHHEPLNKSENPSNIIEINPHLHGYNGSNEISGAGVSFLFAYALDPQHNIDLLQLALVGAVGDIQDQEKQHSLKGLNDKFAQLGVKENLVKIEKDLYFQYREMKPIHHALMETNDPYLPGLTGNEEACVRFLGSIGVPLQAGDNWRTISDLSTEEKRNLTTQLTQLILSHGGTSEEANNLVCTKYLFLNETEIYLKDAREYAELLNACGRTRNSGAGVAVCMGDRTIHYRQAQDLLLTYQKKIDTFLENLKHPGTILETDHVQYFMGGALDETMIGTITTIATKTKLTKPNKALIGFAGPMDDVYKISARAQDKLVEKGVHLGKALRETISQLGLDNSKFRAGGHDAAAGTRVPKTHDKLFIETLNKVIEKQISN